MSDRLRAPSPRVALALAAAVVAGAVLYLARDALTPFVIGLVLIYILDPGVRWLHRRGLPRGLAVLVVYAITLFVLVEGVTLLIRPLLEQLATFMQELPRLAATLDEQLRRVTEVYNRLQLPQAVRDAVQRAVAGAGEGASGFTPTSLLPIARTVAGTLTSVFGFLIVPVWAFYILKDRDRLAASFDRALPDDWREDTWAVVRIVERVFGRWLRGQVFLGVVVGVATFAGLLLLGAFVDQRFLQFAVLLAVVAGVLELLPIIGPIIAMVPALLLALTMSPQAIVAVLILYIAVQQVENNVLVPRIQGNAIELHASVVIFALVIGGAIAGLLGAIFALPVTAAARDVYRYLYRRVEGAPASVAAGQIARERGTGDERESAAPPEVDDAPKPRHAPETAAGTAATPSEPAGAADAKRGERPGRAPRARPATDTSPRAAEGPTAPAGG